ncbi:hypothetical protein [Halolamina salifodinae]|uniref:Uncharacterized protein n=1 Tax=Halolamina salifodinae TaxID=1202767 RepID=A0A8T4GX68_9EURY|nr:hypothetical protein [Halolamina salifodinae]MBP1986732.1 hypothetical protein [Halolamina salifodinae]
MADVDDRGQLLLVGALTFAVMLVALAVLLNAAIYTGNVATRDAGPGTGEAIEYENGAAAMVETTIASLNERGNASYADLRQTLNRTIVRWSEVMRPHSGATLADTTLRNVSIENGTRIAQTETGAFTNNSTAAGARNWNVSADSRVRAFRLNVSRSSLNDTDNPVADGAFEVRFANGSHDWTVYLHRTGSGNVSVTAVGVDDASESCSVDTGSRAIVDLTAETIDGRECPALASLSRLDGPYDIQYRNATDGAGDPQVTGTYSLVVDRSLDPSVTEADTDADGLNATAALYGADLRLTYRTADVYYNSEFRVAPGEADD